MQERMEAIVTGRVQMVMFRAFVQGKAKQLKLKGEVRNMKDGTVLVIAEGARSALENLLIHLHHGSFLSSVQTVTPNWLPASNSFTKFDINYD